MYLPEKFSFYHETKVEVHNETCNGEPVMNITSFVDEDGNLDRNNPVKVCVSMDNHQMYLLAMKMLSMVETTDRRGSC